MFLTAAFRNCSSIARMVTGKPGHTRVWYQVYRVGLAGPISKTPGLVNDMDLIHRYIIGSESR